MTTAPEDSVAAREAMVARQLRARGIRDERTLEAMRRVAREKFFPRSDRRFAYRDGAFSIGLGQTISQPYMVALMTEALGVTRQSRVLEVGTGSGYQAAILAELARHVYTVERLPELSRRARRALCEELGYGNISFRVGDGTLGWPEQAPFDRFMVTAGAPARPQTLIEQLAPGGQGVAPVGSHGFQTLMRYRKGKDGAVEEEELCQCVFVKLIGKEGWQER